MASSIKSRHLVRAAVISLALVPVLISPGLAATAASTAKRGVAVAPRGPVAPAGVPPVAAAAVGPFIDVTLSDADREAIGRVAFAEAGNQAEEGLAGVICTILNRLHSGAFGANVTGVLDSPGQFEPVTDVGGQWSNLPALSPGQAVEFNTILDLILQGRLPDPTNGALYFQNPATVAQRAAAGEVSAALVNFGGQTPSAIIRDHSFYIGTPRPRLFSDGSAPNLFEPLTGIASMPAGLFVPIGTSFMAVPAFGTPPAAPVGAAGGVPKAQAVGYSEHASGDGNTDHDPSGGLFESNAIPGISVNPRPAQPSPGAIDAPVPGVASIGTSRSANGK